MSDERIFELLDEADELEPSLTQVGLYEEAMKLADELGLDDLAFQIRKRLMNAAVFSGAAEKLMLAFSWCLGKVDESPDEFDEIELFWEFKWAISTACRFPQVSLEQIRSMLKDYEMRLQRNGFSLRPAVYLQMCLAMTLGEVEQAEEFAARWPNLPRDYFADCEACELDQVVELRVLRHRDSQAIDLAKPLLEEEMTCAEVPHRTLALLLEPAMRSDRMDLAAECHRRGYPMIVDNPDFLAQLGKHAIYLARVGDFERGLQLIEKHIGWAYTTLEAGDRMDFYAGVVALLRAYPNETISIRLPSGHPLRKPNAPIATETLRTWFEGELDTMCQKFDARNGSEFQSQLINDWLELAAS